MNEATIAAVSTAYSKSAIGIVRLSGNDAIEIAGKMFKSYSGKKITQLKGFSGTLGRVFDNGTAIDEAIAFVYYAPKSYTGENIVEFSCHGGTAVLNKVLRACFKHGARPAEPGEFTKRAFLNGKMGLNEAEAVMDIINSQGSAALSASMSARDGALSRKIREISDKLIKIISHIDAFIDYPDEDLEELSGSQLFESLNGIKAEINKVMSTYDHGKLIYNGIKTVIAGRPNVGKSTLMNLLTGYERSIVTDIAGTTRDIIEETVNIKDFVLRISDTAGIRDTKDIIESMGVDRSLGLIDSSDLVLAVFDSSEELVEDDIKLLELVSAKNLIAVVNKIDLDNKLNVEIIRKYTDSIVNISSKTGAGKEELEEKITELLKLAELDLSAPIIANERQYLALRQAKESLNEAVNALLNNVTLDAVNIDIENSVKNLLAISGENVSDKVIDEIFAAFCVGK